MDLTYTVYPYMIYCNCRFRWGCSIDYTPNISTAAFQFVYTEVQPLVVAGQSSGEGGDLHGTDGSHGNSSNRRSTQWTQHRRVQGEGEPWGTLSQARVKNGQNVEEDLEGMDYEHHPILFFQSPFSDGLLVFRVHQGPGSRPQAEFTPQALANRCRSGWFQLSSKVSPKLTSDETDSG